MNGQQSVVTSSRATLAAYVTGFILSLTLTIAMFLVVQAHINSDHAIFSHRLILPVILSLAVVQSIVQLVFFLHIGKETRPRWKLLVFLFMIGVIGIIVIGSLWIMSNLNVRMTPQQVNTYLKQQDGL